MRQILCRILLLMLVCSLIPGLHALAANEDQIPIIGEFFVPDDYHIKIQGNCSGHGYFYDVAMRQDGWFAVVYRTSTQKEDNEGYLSRVFIDIFDETGDFQKEISVKTDEDVVVRLTDESLELFFYDHLLCVDLQSEEISGSRIRAGYADSSGLREAFNRKEFVVDGWEYRCVRTFTGYTSLVRTKGDTTEVLLSLSGNIPVMNLPFEIAMLVGICNGFVIVVVLSGVVVWIMKKRKKGKAPKSS